MHPYQNNWSCRVIIFLPHFVFKIPDIKIHLANILLRQCCRFQIDNQKTFQDIIINETPLPSSSIGQTNGNHLDWSRSA